MQLSMCRRNKPINSKTKIPPTSILRWKISGLGSSIQTPYLRNNPSVPNFGFELFRYSLLYINGTTTLGQSDFSNLYSALGTTFQCQVSDKNHLQVHYAYKTAALCQNQDKTCFEVCLAQGTTILSQSSNLFEVFQGWTPSQPLWPLSNPETPSVPIIIFEQDLASRRSRSAR